MQMEGSQGVVMMLLDRFRDNGGGDLRVPHLREAREIKANALTIILERSTAIVLETNGGHYVLEIGYSSCAGDSVNASAFC